MSKFFYTDGKKKYGPFSKEELKERAIRLAGVAGGEFPGLLGQFFD